MIDGEQPEDKRNPFDEAVAAITKPIDMLRCILDHEDYYGHDPYYGDIKATIFNKARSIVAAYDKENP